MEYEVAAIDLQDLVAGAVLALLDLVVDRESGDFFNGLLGGCPFREIEVFACKRIWK